MQGWTAVELEEQIALGSCHCPFGPEDIPAALGAVSDVQAVSVKTDGGDDTRSRLSAVEHPGVLEAVAVAGQSSGDDDRGGQVGVQPAHERAAVHPEPIGEDNHPTKRRSHQILRNVGSGAERTVCAVDGCACGSQASMVEARHGYRDGGVRYLGSKDLTRGRTPQYLRAGIGRSQTLPGLALGGEFRGAEGQHQRAAGVERRKRRNAPAVAFPGEGFELHPKRW